MSEITSAFYKTNDIMSLCDCGKDSIERLEKRGVIPKHMNRRKGSKEEKRWLRSAVDKKLGIGQQSLDTDAIREIIQQEIMSLLRAQGAQI